MNNFYIWGWHGQLNTGDDAFAIVTNWGLRKYNYASKVIMDTDISKVLSKNYKITTAFRSGIKIPVLGRLSRVYYRSISNGFVLAGGSLLESEEVLKGLLNDLHWNKSVRKIFALGISVGPFQSSKHEELTLLYLRRMSFIGFRDDYSYEWACFHKLQAPFERAFDLAVLLPKVTNFYSHPIKKEKVLGISLLAFNSRKNKDYLTKDLEFARSFARATYAVTKERGFKIVLYSICRNPSSTDDIMCKAFVDSLPHDSGIEIRRHNGDAYRTLTIMQECSHFASMRLHGSIFSYINQIPLLLLAYHPKCKSFAETVGLDSRLYIDIENFDPSLYIEALHLLLGKSYLDTAMPLASAQKRALLNFEGLSKHI